MPPDANPRFNARPLVVASAVVLAGVALVALLALSGLAGQRGESKTAPAVTLRLASGQTVDLSGSSGSPIVVINFFASWCPPCRDEAPALRQVWNRLRGDNGVLMVGIVYRDDADAARSYLRDYDLGFEPIDDEDGSLARAFRVSGIPKTFVIAPGGRVVFARFGVVGAGQLLAAIEEARIGIP